MLFCESIVREKSCAKKMTVEKILAEILCGPHELYCPVDSVTISCSHDDDVPPGRVPAGTTFHTHSITTLGRQQTAVVYNSNSTGVVYWTAAVGPSSTQVFVLLLVRADSCLLQSLLTTAFAAPKRAVALEAKRTQAATAPLPLEGYFSEIPLFAATSPPPSDTIREWQDGMSSLFSLQTQGLISVDESNRRKRLLDSYLVSIQSGEDEDENDDGSNEDSVSGGSCWKRIHVCWRKVWQFVYYTQSVAED